MKKTFRATTWHGYQGVCFRLSKMISLFSDRLSCEIYCSKNRPFVQEFYSLENNDKDVLLEEFQNKINIFLSFLLKRGKD